MIWRRRHLLKAFRMKRWKKQFWDLASGPVWLFMSSICGYRRSYLSMVHKTHKTACCWKQAPRLQGRDKLSVFRSHWHIRSTTISCKKATHSLLPRLRIATSYRPVKWEHRKTLRHWWGNSKSYIPFKASSKQDQKTTHQISGWKLTQRNSSEIWR